MSAIGLPVTQSTVVLHCTVACGTSHVKDKGRGSIIYRLPITDAVEAVVAGLAVVVYLPKPGETLSLWPRAYSQIAQALPSR